MFHLLHHELQLKHYVEYSQSVNKRPHYLFGKVPDYHSQGDSLQKKLYAVIREYLGRTLFNFLKRAIAVPFTGFEIFV